MFIFCVIYANRRLYLNGHTLIELIATLSVIGILTAVTIPIVTDYYADCALKTTVSEVVSMIRDARMMALDSGEYRAVSFDAKARSISLVLDRGADGEWNTSDDKVARTLNLAARGRLYFGYGLCGPVPGLAHDDDGITFQTDDTLVCNPDLSSNAGTVYLASDATRVKAITVNSSQEGCKIRTCSNGRWLK